LLGGVHEAALELLGPGVGVVEVGFEGFDVDGEAVVFGGVDVGFVAGEVGGRCPRVRRIWSFFRRGWR
jgi:hypothetical protein